MEVLYGTAREHKWDLPSYLLGVESLGGQLGGGLDLLDNVELDVGDGRLLRVLVGDRRLDPWGVAVDVGVEVEAEKRRPLRPDILGVSEG